MALDSQPAASTSFPTLHPGDRVAVLAPASGPRDLDRYREGLQRLRDTYDVVEMWTPGDERGYLAAPDASRVEAFNTALRRSDVRAIICVRGGYGAMRLLPHLDYDAARRDPKLLVGYSDVTALHLALYRKAGWLGLSGPVVTEWAVAGEEMLDATQSWMTTGRGAFDGPDGNVLTPVVLGEASGPLLGGNLSVLTRLVGTPYLPDLTGAILVLEDVGEAPYRVDRMLSHLDLAGHLDALGGVVLGDFSTGDVQSPTLSLDDVIADYFQTRSYPVAQGLVYGHCLPRVCLPIGAPVTLSVTEDAATLRCGGREV